MFAAFSKFLPRPLGQRQLFQGLDQANLPGEKTPRDQHRMSGTRNSGCVRGASSWQTHRDLHRQDSHDSLPEGYLVGKVQKCFFFAVLDGFGSGCTTVTLVLRGTNILSRIPA